MVVDVGREILAKVKIDSKIREWIVCAIMNGSFFRLCFIRPGF